MKATIVIEMAKDGTFSCYMEETLPQACMVGFGKTVTECKEDLIAFYDELRETDKTFPTLEFEWKYDIGSFLNYYSFLNITQLSKYVGINGSLLRRYKAGGKATEKTYIKFASGIHAIGRELAEAQF